MSDHPNRNRPVRGAASRIPWQMAGRHAFGLSCHPSDSQRHALASEPTASNWQAGGQPVPSSALTASAPTGLGYNLFWHKPLLFNPGNYAGNAENVFGMTGSQNMLCLPRKVPQSVSGLQPVQVPVAGTEG